MRKLIGLLFVLFVLVGCELPHNPNDLIPYDCGSSYDINSVPLEFKNLNQVLLYVKDNLTYVMDDTSHGQPEYWQAPYDTYNLKTGDCEDLAIFICYFADKLGYDVTLIGVTTSTDSGHMLFTINGALYEYGGVYTKGYKEIIHTWTLAEALARCNAYGSKQVLDSN